MGKKPSGTPATNSTLTLAYIVPEPQKRQGRTTAIEEQARHFIHIYVVLQRQHGQWLMETKRMKTCFCKLAEEFETFKAEGREINIVDFFEAHKQKYGRELQPNHLISKRSLSIYNDYMTQKNTPTFSLSKEEVEEYNEDTIAYLARVRGESKSAVKKMLRTAGLM